MRTDEEWYLKGANSLQTIRGYSNEIADGFISSFELESVYFIKKVGPDNFSIDGLGNFGKLNHCKLRLWICFFALGDGRLGPGELIGPTFDLNGGDRLIDGDSKFPDSPVKGQLLSLKDMLVLTA